MAEFTNHTGKSLRVNSRSYAANVKVCGISEIGSAAASASVLNDVATCTRNGIDVDDRQDDEERVEQDLAGDRLARSSCACAWGG